MKKTVLALFFLFAPVFSPFAAGYYDGLFLIVDNEAVTYNEFSLEYLKLKDNAIEMGQPMPPNAKVLIFRKLINDKIISKIADKKQVFVSESEVDEAINNIKKMNRLTDEAFRQILAEKKKSLKDLKEEYERQILQEKIMSMELQPRIKYPDEAELQAYYNSHKNEMYEGEKVRVSHILIRDNPNAGLEERSRIKAKAQGVLQKARAGEDFKKLAEKYSEDTASVRQAGDIGLVAEKEWLPEIDAAVFKLKKGQIADSVLQSRWGWHIVKVTDRQPRRLVPFPDMRGRIANYLIKKKMESEYDKWLKEQMQHSYIEVLFPDSRKYTFDFDKWLNKKDKSALTEDEFHNRINALKI